jgi:hypothetical protein
MRSFMDEIEVESSPMGTEITMFRRIFGSGAGTSPVRDN